LAGRQWAIEERRAAQSGLLSALEQVVHVYIGREALGVSAGLKMEIAASMCARSARACSRSRSYLAMFPAISSRLERNVVTVRISAMKQTGR